jgi:hypothetical protein
MSLGTGCPYAISCMQKLNTRSLTESELVGVDDAMSLVVWIFCLDKDSMSLTMSSIKTISTMLLENNTKMSSSKWTCHLDV